MKILYAGLISAVLFVTSSFVAAQSGQDHINHFSLGISVGSSQYQWNLSSRDAQGEGITTDSHSNPGFSASVSAAYAFGNHWKLRLSPEVQSRSFDYHIDGLHFGEDFNGLGFGEGSQIIYDIKATTFRVPVTVEYIFGTKKILPFISLGLAGEFVLKQSGEGTVYYNDGTTDPLHPGSLLRKNNLAAIAGAGIYYRASNNISLSISPVFSYSLLDDPQKRHQYSFGAMTGIFLDISK